MTDEHGVALSMDQQIDIVRRDLLGKLQRRDWHGVADCAMDLRELEAVRRTRAEFADEFADAKPVVYGPAPRL